MEKSWVVVLALAAAVSASKREYGIGASSVVAPFVQNVARVEGAKPINEWKAMKSTVTNIRVGKGPFWGCVKSAIKAILSFHLPVNRITRPLFGSLYWCHVAARETLIMFLRFLWFEPLFRSQCERVGRGFQMEQLPYITGSGQIQIGDNVRLSGKPGLGFCNRFGNLPKLTIGNRTFIGHRCDFSIGSSITIGNDCLIAGGVSIRDYDGHPIDAKERREGKCVSASDVKQVLIGDDVWICSGATILKGVTVGARAIVAANSTVTSDVPPDTIVGGCPAVIIKKLIPTSHE